MGLHKRLGALPHMYEHIKPDARILSFAEERIDHLKEEIEQAHLEIVMWQRVTALVEPHQCKTCGGYGEVSYVDDPMDGRRFKKCPDCKGTGK